MHVCKIHVEGNFFVSSKKFMKIDAVKPDKLAESIKVDTSRQIDRFVDLNIKFTKGYQDQIRPKN